MGIMLIFVAVRRLIRRRFPSLQSTGGSAALHYIASGYLHVLSILFSFLMLSACSSSWSPSDDEALKLVQNYYLFYHEGRQVEARIIKRHTYSKDCDCVPVEFRVKFSDKEGFKKVFYFFKNEEGKTDIRIHRLGLQHTGR